MKSVGIQFKEIPFSILLDKQYDQKTILNSFDRFLLRFWPFKIFELKINIYYSCDV
jgi:hypothetical protein